MLTQTIFVCATLVLIVAIIAVSCTLFSISEAKRALKNAEERSQNLEELVRYKDSEHDRMLKSKEEDGKRMADIIKSLMEKQQRYSVDALINQRKEG
jgi:hypothetical protein